MLRSKAASLLRRLADWLDPEPSHPVVGLGASLHSEIGELRATEPIVPSMPDALGHQGGIVDDDDDGWSGGGLYL